MTIKTCEHQEWKVGRTRIKDSAGYIATVVYVGPVASASDPKEVYVGVVWDDHSRGKHDGSVIDRSTGELVRHFHAPHPTAGSFLRLRKVDTGAPLSPALLRGRYVALQSDECVAPGNLLPHTVQTVSGRNDKVVEFLGEMKIRSQQQLEDLTSVTLRRWGISSVTPCDTWESLSHITELDLAVNLLFEWQDISNLIQALPHLSNLSLACNRLCDLGDMSLPQSQTLTNLNLRETNLTTTASILSIGRSFSQLQELSLADCTLQCNAEDAADLAAAFAHLQLLDCSGCQLDSSTQVLAWSLLPQLESLSLDNNHGFNSWQGMDPTIHFAALQHLQLAGTGWHDWLELSTPLHQLPRLHRLRLRNCPLQTGIGAGQSRIMTIGYLPKLQALNGSPVSSTERKDAARWYARTMMMAKNDDAESAQLVYWKTHHSADWGALANVTGEAATGSVALIDSIRSVTIRSMAANSCTMAPLVRRFPAELTIGRLKALCARHFGLDMDLQALYYRSSPDQAFPNSLEGEDRSLAYYGVPDGAEILMNEIDVEALKREKRQAKEELLARVDREEEELKQFQAKQKLLHQR